MLQSKIIFTEKIIFLLILGLKKLKKIVEETFKKYLKLYIIFFFEKLCQK